MKNNILNTFSYIFFSSSFISFILARIISKLPWQLLLAFLVVVVAVVFFIFCRLIISANSLFFNWKTLELMKSVWVIDNLKINELSYIKMIGAFQKKENMRRRYSRWILTLYIQLKIQLGINIHTYIFLLKWKRQHLTFCHFRFVITFRFSLFFVTTFYLFSFFSHFILLIFSFLAYHLLFDLPIFTFMDTIFLVKSQIKFSFEHKRKLQGTTNTK